MRRLYKPHFRGIGDGLAFHVLFGFGGMEEANRRLVAEELPLVMDDIAELIRGGYTVVLDTEATLGRLREALYGEVSDVPGLRTAGVFWTSPGYEDGTLVGFDGARFDATDLRAEHVDRLLRLLVLSCSWAGRRLGAWQRACGRGCHVLAWNGELERGDRMGFLDARGAAQMGLHDLIRTHMLEVTAPPPPPLDDLADEELMTSAAGAHPSAETTQELPRLHPADVDTERTQAFNAIPADAPRPAPRPAPPREDDNVTRVFAAIRDPAPPAASAPATSYPGSSPARPAPVTGVQPTPHAAEPAAATGFAQSFTPGEPAPAAPEAAPVEASAAALVKADVEEKKPADPLGSVANSVFQAFSGGRSLDQVVGEQLKKHKLLGGVASTVLPGLVSFAGSAAAKHVNDTGARRAIASATEAASRILTPEEEKAAAEQAAAAEARAAEPARPAPPASPREDVEGAPHSPKEVEVRLRRVAEELGAPCVWVGDVMQLTVPLDGGRRQAVYARIVGEGPIACLSLYCHVGALGQGVDLLHALRLTAQTYYTRASLVANDGGDAIVCQANVPRQALVHPVLRLVVEEIAAVGDGLEGRMFGQDVY